jgi:ABC-2 type transport system permease protein
MPLFFASNALYPVEVMPGWLQALSAINPLRYEIDGLRGLLIGTPSNLPVDVAVLAVACAAGIGVSARLLRRLAA